MTVGPFGSFGGRPKRWNALLSEARLPAENWLGIEVPPDGRKRGCAAQRTPASGGHGPQRLDLMRAPPAALPVTDAPARSPSVTWPLAWALASTSPPAGWSACPEASMALRIWT